MHVAEFGKMTRICAEAGHARNETGLENCTWVLFCPIWIVNEYFVSVTNRKIRNEILNSLICWWVGPSSSLCGGGRAAGLCQCDCSLLRGRRSWPGERKTRTISALLARISTRVVRRSFAPLPTPPPHPPLPLPVKHQPGRVNSFDVHSISYVM